MVITHTMWPEWLPVSKEEVLNNKNADTIAIYAVEKVLAERAVWEFAEQHPHIEVTSGELTQCSFISYRFLNLTFSFNQSTRRPS